MTSLQCTRSLTICAAMLCTLATPLAHSNPWTLVPEDPVTLIRGTERFEIDAPLALEPGDIVDTKAGASTRIDDGDGTLIAPGAGTRLLIAEPSRDAGLSISMLTGWLKLARLASSTPLAVDTPSLHIDMEPGSVVIHAGHDETALFVESGTVVTTAGDGSGTAVAVPGDHFLQRAPGAPVRQSARPDASFASAVPVAFRDALAPLPAARRAKSAAPANGQPVAYDDIAAWLTCDLPARTSFLPRFQALARSEPFRTQIRVNLDALPEWRPIVFPPPAPLHRSGEQHATPEVL